MTDKEKYAALCKTEKDIPLFLQHDWIAGILPEASWEVLLAEHGQEVLGFMPVNKRRKAKSTVIATPLLTPFLGPWLRYPESQKMQTRIRFEMEIMHAIIMQIPRCAVFDVKFSPAVTNWLPFYWSGYKQTTHYTYIFPAGIDAETLSSRFSRDVRTAIKKAEHELIVSEEQDPDVLFNMKIATYRDQKAKLPVSREYYHKVFRNIHSMECGKLWKASDAAGNIHAAVIFVYDRKMSYYLFGASDPSFRNTGAMSLLLWEGIKDAAGNERAFNFEGSMVPGVERFFRNFGAEQVPYFRIYKLHNPLVKLVHALRGG